MNYKQLAKRFPTLKDSLKSAGIVDTPEEYVKKTFMTALMMAVGLTAVVLIVFQKLFVILVPFIVGPPIFLYLMKFVDVKIVQLQRKIDEEIVFAGRFLIIELHSGVPIHEAFETLAANYETVGVYFGDIVDKMYLGTALEDSINDVLLNSPSPTLRRILWQLLNSMKTGSDIAPALNSVIEQIVKEQEIAVKEYGKKLNPLAMFYMMLAVIAPSLGIVMLVVMATFVGFSLSLTILLAIAGMIGFVQLMFMTIMKSSRPPISMG